MAPIVKETNVIIVPVHFPNINPAANAIGLPKPKRSTQTIVNNEKIIDILSKLFSVKSFNNSLFFYKLVAGNFVYSKIIKKKPKKNPNYS